MLVRKNLLNMSISEKLDKALGILFFVLLHEKKNIILLSPGGTGKSMTLKYLTKVLIQKNITVSLTAATGIAASNLSEGIVRGRTLHSWAGVGLARESADKLAAKIMSHKLSLGDKIANAHDRWYKTDVLMVDEISMIGISFLEKLDYIGRVVRNNPKVAFGGIKLIFSGDWMQLPPVKDDWCFLYSRWHEFNFHPFIFKTPLRFQNKTGFDDVYFELLSRIREGVVNEKDVSLLKERVEAYDKYVKSPITMSDVKPTVLFPLKADVYIHNKNELNALSTPLFLLNAIDNYTSLNHRFPLSIQQMIDRFQIHLDDMIPRSVELKVGAQVMLKKNLDFERKLVNGSRGVITSIIKKKELMNINVINNENISIIDKLLVDFGQYKDDDVVIIEVKFLNGETERIKREIFSYETDDVSAIRVTFPLILAWCLTVHSAQGSTIDYAICDLGPQNFASGQAYVSLSRVKNLEGLLVSRFSETAIKMDQIALNKIKEMEKKGFIITFPKDLFEN